MHIADCFRIDRKISFLVENKYKFKKIMMNIAMDASSGSST